MRLVGYLVNTPGSPVGERGAFYDYILAGNGVFLEAENPLLEARVWLAPAPVRGLEPLEPYLRLRHGKVNAGLLSLALVAMSGDPDREMFAAVVWDGEEHRLIIPPQEREPGHVRYEPVPGTVVGIHSHGTMGAFFSGTDDRDDQGFQVSIVVGHLDRLVPAAQARLCVYGYFAPVDLRDVVAGVVPWVEAENVDNCDEF